MQKGSYIYKKIRIDKAIYTESDISIFSSCEEK